MSDILWGIFAELKCSRLLYADTLLFFLAMALSIYAWTLFIVAYMKLDGAPRGRVLWTGRNMLAYFCDALVVNGFTGVLLKPITLEKLQKLFADLPKISGR